MADQYIQVPPDSTGKKVDATSLDVGVDSVLRQRIIIADNAVAGGFAAILSSGPAGTEGGLVVRNIPSGTQSISGIINNISATVTVAFASPITVNNISATVNTVLGAGTSNIGFINNISATVAAVLGAGGNNIGGVSLVAGTSNIGFIDSISRTVIIAVATPFTLNNISATVAVGLAYVFDSTQQTNQVHVGDSANSAIRVNIVAGAAAGGTSMLDGAGFTPQASSFTPSGGEVDDTAPGVLAEGSAGAVRVTPYRAFHVNMRTSTGTAMEDTTNNALRVNIVAGAAAGGTSQTDGAPFTAQTTPFTPFGGYVDDTAPGVLAEGSAGAVRVTPYRAMHVNFRDSAGAELGNTSATGLFVRTASVILIAGTSNIGTINDISRTVQVAIGTPFTVNDISATVNTVVGAGTALMGAVSLAAGTANIGFINGISATIAAVLAAGTANIGTINNVSATIAAVLAAGTANFGTLNNISATVACGLAYVTEKTTGSLVQVGDSLNAAVRVNIVADTFATAVTEIPSASHGPRMVNVSVSAATELIASPGTGLSIYVTQLMVSNSSVAGPVLARIGTSASASAVVMMMAANGGGFVMNFDPPWKLSASERALCSVKPQGASGFFNINFYVAA